MKHCSKIDNSTSVDDVVPTQTKSEVSPTSSSINSTSNCEHIETNNDSDTDSSYDRDMKIMSDRMPQILTELNSHYQAISEKSKLRYKNKKPITGQSRPNVKGHSSKLGPHKSSFHGSPKTAAHGSSDNVISEKAFAQQKRTTSGKLRNKYRQKLPPKPGTKTSEKLNKTFRNTSDNSNSGGPSGTDHAEDEESVHSEMVNETDQSSDVSDTEILELKNLTLKNVNSIYGGTYYEDVSARKNRNNPSDTKESNDPITENECGNFSMCARKLASSESQKIKSSFKCQSTKSFAGTKNEGSRKDEKISRESVFIITDSCNEKLHPLKKDVRRKQKKSKFDFGQGCSAGPTDTTDSRDDSSKFSNCDRKQGKPSVEEKKILNSKKIKNASVTNNSTNKEENFNFKSIHEGEKSTCKKDISKPTKKSEFIPKAILKRPQSSNIPQSPSVVEPIDDATKEDKGIDMDMSNFLDKMLEETSVVTPAIMNASSFTTSQRILPQDEDLDKLFEESLCKPSFASRKRLLNNKLT